MDIAPDAAILALPATANAGVAAPLAQNRGSTIINEKQQFTDVIKGELSKEKAAGSVAQIFPAAAGTPTVPGQLAVVHDTVSSARHAPDAPAYGKELPIPGQLLPHSAQSAPQAVAQKPSAESPDGADSGPIDQTGGDLAEQASAGAAPVVSTAQAQVDVSRDANRVPAAEMLRESRPRIDSPLTAAGKVAPSESGMESARAANSPSNLAPVEKVPADTAGTITNSVNDRSISTIQRDSAVSVKAETGADIGMAAADAKNAADAPAGKLQEHFSGLQSLLQHASVVSPKPSPVSIATPMTNDMSWPNAFGEKIAWLVGKGEQSATIQLAPEELGKLQLRITMTQGGTQIEVHARNSNTADLMESMLPKLQASLENHGIRMDEVKFSQVPLDTGREFPNPFAGGRDDNGKKAGELTQQDSDAPSHSEPDDDTANILALQSGLLVPASVDYYA